MVREMRTLLLLLFGAVCGVVGTVLFTTLDPGISGSQNNGAGGGNARLSLDEDALAAVIKANLQGVAGIDDRAAVSTAIREDGLILVDLEVPAPVGVGVRSSLLVNPDIEDGQLVVHVVQANLGDVAVPDVVAQRIELPLQSRLSALAGGTDYTLTSITTADHRLTLEVRL
jgi:hypothetical protein